jgi:hypothetical protein
MTNLFKLQEYYARLAEWAVENNVDPALVIRQPAFHVRHAAFTQICKDLDEVFGRD